jgi:hypothetical protein
MSEHSLTSPASHETSASGLRLSPKQEALANRMLSPWIWRLYALKHLPSVVFWRVRIKKLSAGSCEVTMPFAWRTQNPFNSTYFAAQCGAAELSTGALALLHLEGQPKTSMLVTQFDSKYYKKVSQPLRFICHSGQDIQEAIAAAAKGGEGQQVVALSQAFLPDGTLASEFWVTWSFRRK